MPRHLTFSQFLLQNIFHLYTVEDNMIATVVTLFGEVGAKLNWRKYSLIRNK